MNCIYQLQIALNIVKKKKRSPKKLGVLQRHRAGAVVYSLDSTDLHVTTQYCMAMQNCWGSVPGRSLVVWFQADTHSNPPIHFSYRATHLGRRPLVRSTIIVFRNPPPPPPIFRPGYGLVYRLLYLNLRLLRRLTL